MSVHKSSFTIAHDSAELLDELTQLVEAISEKLPHGVSVRFESVKSDFGHVVLEWEE